MTCRARSAPATLLLALLLAAVPAGAQHDHGGTTHGDTVTLGPAAGGSDVAAFPLYTIGIELSPGYTFQFSWSVDNATGPPVHFEIFAHSSSVHVVYYAKNGSQDSGAWQVPGTDVYYVSWANPNAVWVNVTYAFQGIPSSDMTPIIAGAVVLILAIVAYVGLTARRILRESAEATKAPKAEATPAAGRLDAAPPEGPVNRPPP